MTTPGPRPPSGAPHGTTLVELLCCLLLLAILGAMAYPSWQAWQARQQVTQAGDRLAGSLALARTAAAARRTEVLVEPLPGAAGFDGGWRLRMAAGEDGSGGSEATVSTVQLHHRCLTVRLRASGGESALRVTAVGYSRTEHGGFFAATFTLRCRGEQRLLRVGAQGRIRICTPGQDPDCDTAGPP